MDLSKQAVCLAPESVVSMLHSILSLATIYREPTMGVRGLASSWGSHHEQHGPDQSLSNTG